MFAIIPGIGKAVPLSVLADPRTSIDTKFLIARDFRFADTIVDEAGQTAMTMNVYAIPSVELTYFAGGKKAEVVNIPLMADPINIAVCPRGIDAIPGFNKKSQAKMQGMIASILSYTAKLNELQNGPMTTSDAPDAADEEEEDDDIDFSQDETDDGDGDDGAADDVIDAMANAVSSTDAAEDLQERLMKKIETVHRFLANVSSKPERKFFSNSSGDDEPVMITESLSVTDTLDVLGKVLDVDSGELAEAEAYLRVAANECLTQVVTLLTASTTQRRAPQTLHTPHASDKAETRKAPAKEPASV